MRFFLPALAFVFVGPLLAQCPGGRSFCVRGQTSIRARTSVDVQTAPQVAPTVIPQASPQLAAPAPEIRYIERSVPEIRYRFIDRPVFVDRPVETVRYVDRPVFLERQQSFSVPSFERTQSYSTPFTFSAPQSHRLNVRTGPLGKIREVDSDGPTHIRVGPFGRIREIRPR